MHANNSTIAYVAATLQTTDLTDAQDVYSAIRSLAALGTKMNRKGLTGDALCIDKAIYTLQQLPCLD